MNRQKKIWISFAIGCSLICLIVISVSLRTPDGYWYDPSSQRSAGYMVIEIRDGQVVFWMFGRGNIAPIGKFLHRTERGTVNKRQGGAGWLWDDSAFGSNLTGRLRVRLALQTVRFSVFGLQLKLPVVKRVLKVRYEGYPDTYIWVHADPYYVERAMDIEAELQSRKQGDVHLPDFKTIDEAIDFVVVEANILKYNLGWDSRSENFAVKLSSGKTISHWLVGTYFTQIFKKFGKSAYPKLADLLNHDHEFVRLGAYAILYKFLPVRPHYNPQHDAPDRIKAINQFKNRLGWIRLNSENNSKK